MSRVNALPTRLGDTSLVQAERRLYEAALKDDANTIFVLVSESCFPALPFDDVMKRLLASPKEGIAYFSVDNHHAECVKAFRQAGVLADKTDFWLCSRWKALSRRNATEFCAMMASPEHTAWRSAFNDCLALAPCDEGVNADESMYVNHLVQRYGKQGRTWWRAAGLRQGVVTVTVANGLRDEVAKAQAISKGGMFARRPRNT